MYLIIRENEVIAKNSLEENESADMEITQEEWDTAGRIARVIDSKIVLGYTEDEKQCFANIAERDALLREITERDYRALKAFKLGEELDVLYPGETDWYKEAVARVNELNFLLRNK